jgi:hypothetical protein
MLFTFTVQATARLAMPITARIEEWTTKLDQLGKPAWIALTILGFVIWWPVGLALLAFIIGSGRMGWKGRGHWHDSMSAWSRQSPSSGNRAFDEYRSETLKRLEEEQREFREFLDRLRFAKDKTEFDQFMAERRNRQQGPATAQT